MTQWDDFDCTLATALSELPPSEETVRDVTPWRTAMDQIILGLCLTCFTLNGWYLQYILPAVGSLLIYFGFRTLRQSNCWFRRAWYISTCKVILLYISMVLDATPFADAIPIGWMVPSIAMTFALFLCFHLGLTQAAREVDQTPQRRPALWATVWYAVLVLMALFVPDIRWLGVIPSLVAFVCIIRSMLYVKEELENWGYAVRAAPVKIGCGWFSALYLASLLLAVLLTAAASNHIAMPSCEQAFDSSETAAIQVKLQGLGFPEDLLDRLPDEELLRLEDAYYCSVHRDGGEAETGSKRGVKAIRFDTVYVQTAPHTIRVYEFFNFQEDTLRSNFRTMTMLEPTRSAQVSDITGGLTWTMNGTAYRSQLPISRQAYESMFFGSSTLSSAIFSYPFFSEDRAGYMAYTSYEEDDVNLTCSVLRAYLTTYRNFYPYGKLTTDTFQTDWYAQSYSTFVFFRES